MSARAHAHTHTHTHTHIHRGNHETQDTTMAYGFQKEVKTKYTLFYYNLFLELFKSLPLGTCINRRVLVVHGGLWRKPGTNLELGSLQVHVNHSYSPLLSRVLSSSRPTPLSSGVLPFPLSQYRKIHISCFLMPFHTVFFRTICQTQAQ